MDRVELIEHFCLRDDLSTYDPYDIWKTGLGVRVKNLFNHRRVVGYGPAVLLTLYDTYINNRARLSYRAQEYPIVRAMAALSLLQLHRRRPHEKYQRSIIRHLKVLESLRCPGYQSYCWGLGFQYPVAKGIVYSENTPFSTVTPYALEAYIEYSQVMKDDCFRQVIDGCCRFFTDEIKIMYEDGERLATSYGPWRDRVAFNAVAYSMYALALLQDYMPPAVRPMLKQRIVKMYRYIADGQASDGSWKYTPYGRSFIDCFHSCFVLKNILKTGKLLPLPGKDDVILRGYEYIVSNFWCSRTGLYRRFTMQNKPSLVVYDLYDNAEVLNLATMLRDHQRVIAVQRAIMSWFRRGVDFYSQIDRFGFCHNRNTLRWAVMPYIYALSKVEE